MPAKGYEESNGVLRACALLSWIESNLWIRVKKSTIVEGVNNGRPTRTIPLRLNRVQEILANEIAFCWHHLIPVIMWIPKGRQLGISTFVQALGFALAFLEEGYHVLTVAHVEDSATEIFGKSKTFEKNLDPAVRRPMETRQEGRFIWEHGSGIHVASAKGEDAVGKGYTFNFLHFSECANFADQGKDPDALYSSIMGAKVDSPDTMVFFESTAKGKDPFFYAGCERARDPDRAELDRLVFLPWFLDDGYAQPWEEFRQQLLKLGKKDPGRKFQETAEEKVVRTRVATEKVSKGEELWKYRKDLSEDQMVWYRKILTEKCSNKDYLRQRYFPSRYDDCWASTNKCMFSQSTINHYRKEARTPKLRGNLVLLRDGPDFVKRKDGNVRIWEGPKENEVYTIGADVGGEQKGADYNCAYVLRNRTCEVVAIYHGHSEWDHYAKSLELLGYYYNDALLVVERNHNPTVAGQLHRESYQNLYYYYDELALKGQRPARPGFDTNRKTRPELMNHLDKVTRDKSLICHDAGLASEMETFVWVDTGGGKYQATGKNHDDRLMALSLAVYLSKGYEVPEEVEQAKENWAYRMSKKLKELKERKRAKAQLLTDDAWIL